MKLAISLVALFALAAVPGQQQTFRSGTDVVLIDVEVLTKDGLPIEGLKSDQFEVFIDGRRRTILSSEFLRESTTMVKASGRSRNRFSRRSRRLDCSAYSQRTRTGSPRRRRPAWWRLATPCPSPVRAGLAALARVLGPEPATMSRRKRSGWSSANCRATVPPIEKPSTSTRR